MPKTSRALARQSGAIGIGGRNDGRCDTAGVRAPASKGTGRILLATAAALSAGMLASGGALANSPYGVWVDHTGRGAVEVKKCGGELCGVIVWARKAADMRRGCGKKLLGGLRKVGLSDWDQGWIIAPDSGTKYDLAIKPVGRDKLEVTGYAGSKLFSKTMMWTRAPSNLKRCDEPEAKPAQVLAKAENDPPQRPSGVGGPGVPLIPDSALEKKKPVTGSAPAPQAKPPVTVVYDPPLSAPPPPRRESAPTQLALADPVRQEGPTTSMAPATRALVAPQPKAVERAAFASAAMPQITVVKTRVAEADDAARPGASGEQTSACIVRAPFVVASIPCQR